MVSTKLTYPNKEIKNEGEPKNSSLSYNEVLLVNKLRNIKVMRTYKGTIFTELKDTQKGKDIYVVGSGPSLKYIDKNFLKDKVVIGCNHVCNFVKCNYTVRIHRIDKNQDLHGSKLVICEHNCGYSTTLNHHKEPFYYFKHVKNNGYNIDTSVVDSEDKLVVSGSVMSSAIHFAYYLGASNIILIGHDCGFLDAKSNLDNYNEGNNKKTELEVLKRDGDLWEQQTLELVNILRSKGIGVMSINPFINFNLEGHKYSKS